MLKNSEFYETLVDGIGEKIKESEKPKADFEENDPKSSGYIKNRTHWKEEIPEKNVVIAEGSAPSGQYSIVDQWDLSEHLQVGTSYTITMNGYTYSVAAEASNGNITLNLKTSSNNSVGIVYEQNQSGKLSLSGTPTGSKVFKIELNEPAHTVYHTIDPNYLPANIAFLDDLSCCVNITENSDGSFNSDHTYTEIKDWLDQGKNVWCYYDVIWYGAIPVSEFSDSCIIFEKINSFIAQTTRFTITISSSDVVNVRETGFPYIPSISNVSGSIEQGQTIVASHIQAGIKLVDAWRAVDLPKEYPVQYINITLTSLDEAAGSFTGTSDKSLTEIKNWNTAGYTVYAKIQLSESLTSMIPLVSVASGEVDFQGVYYFNGQQAVKLYGHIDSNNNVSGTLIPLAEASQIGDLSDLTTESKDNLVAAINEVKANGSSSDAVLYTEQALTDSQKSQALSNLGISGQVTADKILNPTNTTDLVQYAAFQAAVPMVQMLGISGAEAGQIAKIKTVNSSGNPTSWEAVDMPSGGSGTDLSLGLTSASVGQIIKVKAVDEDGKPTQWEAADATSGDKWELIKTIEIAEGAEETNALTINADENGNAFSLKKARLITYFPSYSGETTVPGYSYTMINGIIGGAQSPLCYTSGLPLLRTDGKNTEGWFEIDLSIDGFEIERVARFSGSGGRPAENMYWGARRLNGAETITSIGGTLMLIYPGCKFTLYGVRA